MQVTFLLHFDQEFVPSDHSQFLAKVQEEKNDIEWNLQETCGNDVNGKICCTMVRGLKLNKR